MNSASNGSRNQILGLILVGLGVLFFVGQFVDFGDILWPFFIIVPGVAMLVWAFVGGRSAAGLAIPGSIVSMIGLILWVQNLTGYYESWAYAWALLIAAGGLGTFLMGVLTDQQKQRDQGWNGLLSGLGLFLAFGAFFELFVFNQTAFARYLVPLALIAVGVWFLIRRRETSSETQLKPKDSSE